MGQGRSGHGVFVNLGGCPVGVSWCGSLCPICGGDARGGGGIDRPVKRKLPIPEARYRLVPNFQGAECSLQLLQAFL